MSCCSIVLFFLLSPRLSLCAQVFADYRSCLLQKFKLGIPIRDMRLLDPNLLTSETGKILVRDNAIVFAMEHIRLIISATTVIIPRDGFEQNLLNSRFNALLEESIIEASHEKQHRESRLRHLREIAESDIDDDTSSGESLAGPSCPDLLEHAPCRKTRISCNTCTDLLPQCIA